MRRRAWAYYVANLRGCVHRLLWFATSRATEPRHRREAPWRSASSTSGKAHDLLRGEVDLSPARADLWCWVVFVTRPPVPLPAGGDAFCVTGLGRCFRGLVAASCGVETSRRSNDLVAQQGVV